jgi:hypothetical protein
VNQRAVAERRAALIDTLYTDPPVSDVLLPASTPETCMRAAAVDA